MHIPISTCWKVFFWLCVFSWPMFTSPVLFKNAQSSRCSDHINIFRIMFLTMCTRTSVKNIVNWKSKQEFKLYERSYCFILFNKKNYISFLVYNVLFSLWAVVAFIKKNSIVFNVHNPHNLSPLSKNTHAERPREPNVRLLLFCSFIRASS